MIFCGSVAEVKSQDAKIAQMLEADPEKALSVPLLRKDVDDLRDESRRDNDALRGQMSQMYDTTKWIIGLIAAGVIGTAFTNLFQFKKPKHEHSAND
jgi:hypothetical protein